MIIPQKSQENTYVNMELAMDRGGDGPEFAKVKKRLRDANGIPIGVANDNPLLDTRIYEVEYLDGYKASLSANEIAQNLFAQVHYKRDHPLHHPLR